MYKETLQASDISSHQSNADENADGVRTLLCESSASGTQVFADKRHPLRKPRMNVKDINRPMILHVDDDVDLVDAVTSRFRASGFRVSCAVDGMSGVQSAITTKTDAIILDYDMPNGRGDVVIDLLKRNERTKNVPIVVLTAIPTKALENKLLGKGADVFMAKPFKFEELKASVESLLC